jgi:hypothetical protein
MLIALPVYPVGAMRGRCLSSAYDIGVGGLSSSRHDANEGVPVAAVDRLRHHLMQSCNAWAAL